MDGVLVLARRLLELVRGHQLVAAVFVGGRILTGGGLAQNIGRQGLSSKRL